MNEETNGQMKDITDEQRNNIVKENEKCDIANIINENIKNLVDKNIQMDKNYLKCSITDNFFYLTEEGDKVFDDIFSMTAPEAKSNRTYFHYKKFEYAYDFIEKRYITLSALSNFVAPFGDVKEYEHFFDVVNIGTPQSFIDEQKNGFYIFCLTENDTTKTETETERFWEEYTDYYKGLRIEMEFEEHKKGMFDLRKVCYDDGCSFCFLNKIQKSIYKKYTKYLLIRSLSKFAAFYKREKYEWENETRLFINWNIYKKNLKHSKIKFMPRTSKNFLKVPFDNGLFTITIKSIMVGKHLRPCEKEKIMELASQRGIPCYDQDNNLLTCNIDGNKKDRGIPCCDQDNNLLTCNIDKKNNGKCIKFISRTCCRLHAWLRQIHH